MEYEKRILIIDDNEQICRLIQSYAKEFTDYTLDYVLNSVEGLKMLENKYELVLLDIQLGEENGFDVIKAIKKKRNIPVIFMSAIKESEVVVSGFELGADDYVKKPVNMKELFYRIERSIARFVTTEGEVKSEIQVADYVFDEVYNKIYKDGKKLKLAYFPSKILILLLKRANTPVSREEIFETVWSEEEYAYNTRTIDTHINSIRIETMDYRIRSVRGIGYIFEF